MKHSNDIILNLCQPCTCRNDIVIVIVDLLVHEIHVNMTTNEASFIRCFK